MNHLPQANYFALPGLKFKGIFAKWKRYKEEEIISAVTNHFGITRAELVGKRRYRNIVAARQLVMWFIKNNSAQPLKSIGAIFNRDHTTVIHSCRTIQDLIQTKDKIVEDIEKIKMMLN